MHIESQEKIAKVCCEVLEQLAFVFADVIEGDDIALPDEGFIHASMSFSGVSQGHAELALPQKLAAQITANILGLDDEEHIETQQHEDAVRELLNTICGRMLTAIYGEEQVFDLHVPKTTLITADDVSRLRNAGSCVLLAIDDMPIIVRFYSK